jgi:CheY-like chemotaxis protein
MQGPDPDSVKLTVLLVEDNAANIVVAGYYLEHLGYEYETAKNGREALAAFRRRKFDIILMDIQMPELDGFDVVRAIREQEHAGGVIATPIIALTSFATAHDREKCLRHGMDDYLSKPFRMEDLQEKIEALLQGGDTMPLSDRLV